MPFARYVLENAGRLEFPFRRYQIQKVWRGERPQEGRFREFTQADIDVIGRDTLAFHHDVEVARVMLDALRRLRLPARFRLQVNNRKLIQGFYAGLGAPDTDAVMRVVDKLDKLPRSRCTRCSARTPASPRSRPSVAWRWPRSAPLTPPSWSRSGSSAYAHELLDEGLAELAAVIEGCAPLVTDRVEIVADLKIARGLDYYTGTVFETRLQGYEWLGSICSGGRYDALANDGRTTYPGVGISLGVSRVLVPLLTRG